MKNLFAFFLSTFIFITSIAQKTEKIISGEVIAQGLKLHDDGQYKEAIKKFVMVSRNDTNYAYALYEKAYSQVADSNFTGAIATCTEGLQLDNDGYELQFLILKGSVIDDMGDPKLALSIYDTALAKYPNAQSLLLNKAVSLMRLKNIDDAGKLLQDLLVRNPFYASAHFRLAQIELQKGQIIPAMMCLYTYLINNPSGVYTNTVIKLLDNLSKVTDDVTEVVSKRSIQPEGSLARVEQIVLSRIALDKQYKVLTDMDDPIIRQLQVMMEKLEYENDNPDFYMQFYVPYLKDIFNKKLFEPAVFEAFSNVNIELIQRYIKKNAKEIKAAANVIATNLETIRSTRELNYAKRQKLQPNYHHDNGKLVGKGNLNNDKPMGNWEFFHDNGNLKSKGQFNNNGKKDGIWTYYFDNGSLNSQDHWSNGLEDGEDLIYNKKGVLTIKSMYSKGKLHGEKTNYFGIGPVYTVSMYKEGKEDGKYLQFYSNGHKKIEANVASDELHGPYQTFHANSQPEIISNYKNGKLDGAYQSYYDNGQLESELLYKNGEPEGVNKTYYSNGKLKSTIQYVNGLIDGEETEFNDAGVLIKKVLYKKGKAEGLASYFDDDSKLYSTLLFENDKLKVAKYFDKNGTVISTSARQNKFIELTTYTAEGFKNSFKIYNEQEKKQNTETYFYPSGKVKEVDSYKDGMMDGIALGYFPNGKIQFEISYAQDKKNGPSRYYFINGQLKSEGWYSDDQLNGDWIEYNEKGRMISLTTYLNNDIYGTRQSFFANGLLDDEEFYSSGWVTGVRQFDTLGKMMYKSALVKGSGTYKGIYFNGKTRFEGPYLYGETHGIFTNYFFDGSILSVKTFKHGEQDGEFTDYLYGGKVATKGMYTLGKKTGTWKYYDIQGLVFRQENYKNGNLDGNSIFYFPDGKVEREIMYKDNEKNGIFKRFAYDGQLAAEFHYKNDVMVAYTYPDKNGQLLPLLPVAGGNGKIVTYYSNGTKSSEMNLADGALHGAYRLYFPDGKLYYEEENQEYGITIGKLKEFYPNGIQKTVYSYYYDNQDGPYKEFYDNGKLKEEGNYYNGILNGSRLFYDKNGKLTETRTYYYGLLINVTK